MCRQLSLPRVHHFLALLTGMMAYSASAQAEIIISPPGAAGGQWTE